MKNVGVPFTPLLYIQRPETRPNIKGILAIAALHQGAPLSDNAQQAVSFFVDVQRRIDGGLAAIKIESMVLFALGYFAPEPARSIIMAIAIFFLDGASGQVLELGQLLNIPQVPALKDLSPDSAAVQGLQRFDDASIPRANVYGTIPFKHAALRVSMSLKGKDRDFASSVDEFNKGLNAFTLCKYFGYATIVLGRQGRACAYARKVMKRIDERWVRYVNGTDGYGRPKYVPFDGVVPNERSRYPTPNALAYDVGVNGVNHQNIYTRQAGLDQVIEGMRRMGMVSGAPPPPPPPPPPGISVSVTGTNPLDVGCGGGMWTANPSGGVAPYTYVWTVDGSPYDTGASNELYYAPTSAGTLSIWVTATDANGNTGTGSTAVTVTSYGNCY